MSPKENLLLAALSEQDFDRIAPNLLSVDLPSGRILCDADTEINQVYFPRSGVVSSLNVLKDGSEVECCTLGNETGFGLLAAMEPAVSITRDIIQVAGEGWVVPARLFRAACLESAALQAAVRRSLRAQMAFMAQSVACNARHKLEARFARWLLTCGAYVDSDVIPLTQEFLAAMLGVQRTTLTEAAAGLQEMGLIRVMRGRVRILDRAGLTLRSCECYDATRGRISALIGSPTPH